MNLLIISCTPRIKEKSNTDKILDEFKKGYESNGLQGATSGIKKQVI